MKTYQVKGILQQKGWLLDSFVTIDSNGKITKIHPKGTSDEYIDGYLLPGFQNAHSHAFQYAMSGLAEIHTHRSRKDDFWAWRHAMYEVALSVNPEQLESIATMLYVEMLRNGYTSVAEFHYLHHDDKGLPYAHISELGERLISAAKTAGIHITLIPIFYQKGGFGLPAESHQRRFLSKDVDDYFRLLEASTASIKHYENAQMGFGIHSLRAADKNSMERIFKEGPTDTPIHLHLAEQLKEVDACVDFYGERPAQWLLNQGVLNERFHLIHCTQLNPQEVKGIAASQAQVVLCPATEGNLGDGIFSLKAFQNQGGKWSIGTDSQINLNPIEELRILDYGQRTKTHDRAQFTSDHQGDTGKFAVDMAWHNGRTAMGEKKSNFLTVGQSLDAVILNANAPLISVSKPENILATLVYSGQSNDLMGTLINGQWVVKNQKHLNQEAVQTSFTKSMRQINIR